MTRVWLHEYARECCGVEPFSVGDYVDWPVLPVERNDWLERLFHGTRVVVDGLYGGHVLDDERQPMRLLGLVVAIDEVRSRMIRTPIDRIADEVDIAEGAAMRLRVKDADWRARLRDTEDVEFVGYLVHLEL